LLTLDILFINIAYFCKTIQNTIKMQIEKKELDNLTSQLTIKIDEKDYQDKVEKKLKDYRKNMEMPGFRKGKVPMNLIKQKYERALIADEVNNQMQEAINNYLQENKIAILGYPIPSKDQKEIDWETINNFEFNFVQIGKTTVLLFNFSNFFIYHFFIGGNFIFGNTF